MPVAPGSGPRHLTFSRDGKLVYAINELAAALVRQRGHVVLAFAPTVISEDTEAAADGFRPHLALYIGGMGAKEMNFHFDVFARMGYEEAATKIQDAYLDGRKDDAAAAVPTAMVEDVALVGPIEKIRDDLEAWRASRATTMLINGDVTTLRTMADLVLG